MLIEAKNYVQARYGSSGRMNFYGQELNGTTWSLCKMNMLFHDIYDAEILQGDTLEDPQHVDRGELKRFDMVIANPPFSANYSDIKNFRDRFHYWMPKKKKADFMFVQHMISLLKDNGRMAVVMPHGVLFRGSEEKNMRRWLTERGYLEAVIGLPQGLFYGTGIPASVLVINKKEAGQRNEVLFINADREYKEGKNQNKLRPEDIAKISYVYRKKEALNGYSRLVSKAELEKEDFNFNIRRYVDNSPPAEPQDVQAHLHGGIPAKEVDEMQGFWSNYPHLREDTFVPLREDYLQFSDNISEKEDLKSLVQEHLNVLAKRDEYHKSVQSWWEQNLPRLEELPEKQNVFELYRAFSKSIASDFSALGILDLHKSRGAFAAYWNSLESDLKSVAASGWNAELIPADDILQSQFPEVLKELADKQARRDELEALFKEVNDSYAEDPDAFAESMEDAEDASEQVYPKEMLKELKAEIKELKGNAAALKKEIKALEVRIRANEETAALQAEKERKEREQGQWLEQMEALENRLAQHTALEKELKEAKAAIKEIKDQKEALVEKAREKISADEARELILGRWKQTLESTVMDYVNRYERSLVQELESRFTKYRHTLTGILQEREAAAEELNGFLMELGYEN
ncbi:MAG: N-6 DNA methylase [Owenweeksia sp.]|nr:N-6 DNA methylase [Owenweeksia sp.]